MFETIVALELMKGRYYAILKSINNLVICQREVDLQQISTLRGIISDPIAMDKFCSN